ncbi:hypothetical protein C2G38_2225779 [Gigaspora rosea]|uniref:Uncharacterized protein n=1 Tax=Gigaspora rosea TaxID=44941 RepID=A0A397TYW7_9GLOM|nr:hypothetical protein C2G38_2225779 [Gigaspora rosea]
MTASVEPSSGYLNRQPKVAGEASCILVNVQMSDALHVGHPGHFELKSLEKHELDLFIKSQLMPAYLKLCGINEYLLSALQDYLQLNRLTEHVHRNTRCASKTESRYEIIPNLEFQPHASLIEYDKHKVAANLERQHYNNNIEESKNNLDIIHICYDWAQNVSIPYSLQQNNLSLWFWSWLCSLAWYKKIIILPEDVENIANYSSKGNNTL